MNKLILQALAFSNEGGGTDVSDTTATAADVLSGKYFHIADGTKVEGTIASKSSSDVTVTFNEVDIPAGYYPSGAYTEVGNPAAGGVKTPTTSRAKIYDAGDILVADAYVEGDANLVAGNIKDGTTIFGVTGTYSGGGGTDVSDTTAVAGDVLAGKYFHIADGTKVEGTIASKSAQTYTPTTSNQTISSGQYLSGAQTISGDANLVAGNIKDGVSIFGVTGNYSGGGGGITSYTIPYDKFTTGSLSGGGLWIPLIAQIGSNLTFAAPFQGTTIASSFGNSVDNSCDITTDTLYDLSSVVIPIESLTPVTQLQISNWACNAKQISIPPVLKLVTHDFTEVTPSTIFGRTPNFVYHVFYNCQGVRTIPSNFFSRIYTDNEKQYKTNSQMDGNFANCYSLRNIPNLDVLASHYNYNASDVSKFLYNSICYMCYNLDTITIPITEDGNLSNGSSVAVTSNMFSNSFDYCNCLSSLVFNNPRNITASKWSNQTIDLTKTVGYTNYADHIFNSGRTYGQKAITDQATWELYHNDIDSYATPQTFSKYNHDSAVETINSLPNCSSGSNNTIKFSGNNGSGYNKAISDLTAAEIAVATAKGWTVSIV